MADVSVAVADIPRSLKDRVCLPLQTPLIRARSTLRVPRAMPSAGSPRRSRRLAAKSKAANPTLQAQNVLMAKLGLANTAQDVDTTAFQKYESMFADPLSESKHEAFKVLFQDDAFLDDFAREVDELLPVAC